MFVFTVAAGLISLYTMLCFIRIILTWFPSMTYNKFTLFLGRICDPYLNVFTKIRFLRLGYVDFSPVVAIAILIAASSLLNNIAMQNRIALGGILAALISTVWSIASSILGLLAVLVAIRLIALLVTKNSTSPIWQSLDSTLNPIIYKVAGMFVSHDGRFVSQKTALLITIAVLIVLQLAGGLLISIITNLFLSLPF